MATAFLAVLWPIFCLIAAAVLVFDGAPIIYAHERVGMGGRRFRCLKFRTMRCCGLSPDQNAAFLKSRKLACDPRVTRLGRFLRATSLDELPQLLNVLVGDMSLVGPRPITEEEVKLYGAAATLYLAVRPGLTGAWQVSGRSNISFADRVAIDADYVMRGTAVEDIRILLRTPLAVLSRSGAW